MLTLFAGLLLATVVIASVGYGARDISALETVKILLHPRGDRRADERQPEEAARVVDVEEEDAEDHEHRGARLHSQDARIGERVHRQCLHHESGGAERGADGRTEEGAGDAFRPQDVVVASAAPGYPDALNAPWAVEHLTPLLAKAVAGQ